MKYNVALLKADIQNELDKLLQLGQAYSSIADKIELPAESVSYFDRGAIGYMLHNFYNGCENMFKSIARFFENDLSAQSWHSDLLKRMHVEVEGFRPQVIDDELYRLLDDFRGFRHKFRHLYGFELDWEREQAIARKLPAALKMVSRQLKQFLDSLETLE